MIKMSNSKDEVNISKLYGEDCLLSKDEFIKKHNLNVNGLSSSEALENNRKYGLNEIKQSKSKKWYNYFFDSLFSPFNIILLGIVLLLCYTDIYLPETPSYSNIIVILILITASTFLDFFEEYRSNKAAENLKELVATTCTVIRDGKEISIPMKNVTLNDIVLLSAGSMIPADLRIIESKDLYVGQSSLTGESDAIKKLPETEITNSEIDTISELDTICFMGTNVISGSAKGSVIKIGDSTYFGKIAHTITSGKPKTAFQKGIESISKLLIRFMLIMIPIVFLLNFQKHDNITAFTFAVAIAITITPLLLPVILSSCLSKGAVRMSKKKTIVKKLDAIQNFGAMNILCTDKTGTLTEDKIVLEKYLDINGNEDLRVLKHAFLNSYFQTGLKGNIDEAVIKRGLEHNMSEISSQYTKIDEIPFDFSRRRLSIVVQDKSQKKQLITKGAVEEILNICTMVDYRGTVSPLTKEIKENITKITKQLNHDGLRVVAVCQKNDITDISNFDVKDEKNMVLLGFIGFLDPPKESAKESILKMNSAGIRVIVLTGDNAEVTKSVCDRVGIKSRKIILGNQIDKLSDLGVIRLLKKNNIFAKLSPIQKARIVRLLKDSGNVVGYMGDGINDSPSLTNSDVGISVDTAVDIAKESADIILLEKDLNVLLDGVTEGRKTFVNLMKYIKMATSFNFGEVLSVIVASIALPFLPETPIQLLVESLLYDFGQMTLPFDNVDNDMIKKPKTFSIKSLKNFMLFMGPISSIFDLVVFATLWFIFGIREAATFQTVWFSYSIVSNLIGMHIIRTSKIPFIQSNAHKMVYFSSILLIIIGLIVPFTTLGSIIGLVPIAFKYIVMIFVITFFYCILALFAKKIYIRKYGDWI
ncbi:MAG: magnesium-translocating P-type ATPase [Clostridium sp.]|nr:magnesium-translocating P-type ATPase [Clostridium sp.]